LVGPLSLRRYGSFAHLPASSPFACLMALIEAPRLPKARQMNLYVSLAIIDL
jgi:hypothetical protein